MKIVDYYFASKNKINKKLNNNNNYEKNYQGNALYQYENNENSKKI